ncbi:MAG TPA: glycosyltransferase [candidate division Zixibacteria bacterium]
MRKKKVLIIAYYFPPLGMGGVQRITKFVKYLPSFGWEPYVLTVKDITYPAKDYSLLKEVPAEAKVIRTGSFDPLRISFLLKSILGKKHSPDQSLWKKTVASSKFTSWIFPLDNKTGWVPFALRKGLRLHKKEKFDLIFTSSPPPSLHVTGYLLSLFTGLPWIADFRDPWIGYKLERFPTPLHLFIKNETQKIIIKKAKRIIAANPSVKEELERLCRKTREIQLVEQGYDEEDFGGGQANQGEIFTIGYLGTFSPDCDPTPFFSAWGEMIDKGMIPRERVRFIHAGISAGINLNRMLEKYNLKDLVHLKGYLPHRESLDLMKKTSLLLLVTADHPSIFPAKVFEYLRLKKPILGIMPEKSQIAKFIIRMKAGKVLSPEDPDGIKKSLFSYLEDFKRGELAFDSNPDEVVRFERRSITARLSFLFDKAAGRS